MSDTKSAEGFRTRRERRVARRRGRILVAAAQVFAQEGFASATTRQIAEAADIAEGTLYNYFGSKREILLAIARESETPMVRALQELSGLEGRDAMVALFEKALDISEAQLPFTQTLVSEAWVDDDILQEFVIVRLQLIHGLLAALIAEQVQAGHFRPVDPDLGARLLMGMFGGLIVPALRGVAPLPSHEERRAIAQRVVGVLLEGVLPQESPLRQVSSAS